MWGLCPADPDRADRARDQHLAAHGYTTIRITGRQLTQHPMAVLANLAHAIARAQALRGL
jgi:very-short-patch-repair endonuclease